MRGCPGRGFLLKEVPHAHADLGELFFNAAVVPFFFRIFRFFLVLCQDLAQVKMRNLSSS